jgi:hypothetical protein
VQNDPQSHGVILNVCLRGHCEHVVGQYEHDKNSVLSKINCFSRLLFISNNEKGAVKVSGAVKISNIGI